MVKHLLILTILLNVNSIFAETNQESGNRYKREHRENRYKKDIKFDQNGKFRHEFAKVLLAAAPKQLKEEIEKAKDPDCPDRIKKKRILLYGPPGNGKTTLVKLAAEQLGMHCEVVNASLLGNEFVNSVKEQFLKKIESCLDKPCVIAVEEVDAVLRESRSDTDPKKDVAQQMWQIFDDLEKRPNIIVFGATNNIKDMPPALRDRFSLSIIEIPHADLKVKKDMLVFYLDGFATECDNAFLLSFVKRCEELSAREIENLVDSAISKAFLRKPAALFITKNDLESSLEDLLNNKAAMDKEKESTWQWTRRKTVEYGDVIGKSVAGTTAASAAWVGAQWVACAKFGVVCSVPPPSV